MNQTVTLTPDPATRYGWAADCTCGWTATTNVGAPAGNWLRHACTCDRCDRTRAEAPPALEMWDDPDRIDDDGPGYLCVDCTADDYETAAELVAADLADHDRQ